MDDDGAKSNLNNRIKGLLATDEPTSDDNQVPHLDELKQIFRDVDRRVTNFERDFPAYHKLLIEAGKTAIETNDRLNEQIKEMTEIQKRISALHIELERTKEKAISDSKSANEAFDQEIAAAKRTLHEHTRLTAPVDLWHEKREEHVKAQEKHQKNFQWSLVVIGVLALAILLVAVFSPNLIDQLFTPVGCDPLQPETCRGISSRSILGGATILTFFTVLLWFTRLQMKLYLAERHLALDARERIAFSRSYVGLLAEGDTSEEAKQQRSLVYAALFRPSSDGAIKEEGGLDPAISAAISKLLTK